MKEVCFTLGVKSINNEMINIKNIVLNMKDNTLKNHNDIELNFGGYLPKNNINKESINNLVNNFKRVLKDVVNTIYSSNTLIERLLIFNPIFINHPFYAELSHKINTSDVTTTLKEPSLEGIVLYNIR